MFYIRIEEYVAHHGILIPDEERDDWRIVAVCNQVPFTLLGQPHQGVVVPRITDGIHAWCDYVYDKERRPIKVCNTNLVRYTPHEAKIFFSKLEPRKKKIKTTPTAQLLAEFGL